MRNKVNQIKLGMVLSYLNIGIGNLIPLFYTPIMLSLLGQNEYGLYKIAGSTTSYLSLLAFGIGSAVTRFLIKANTEGGKEYEERVFGLFNLIFQGLAALTIIVGGLLSLNLGIFYSSSLSDSELTKMQILVAIMVVNTAVGFSAASYNSVVSSHERFIFIQAINILSTVVMPVFNLVVLFLGYKSIAMAIVSLAINVVIRVTYVIYVKKSLQLKARYKKLPFGLMKDIISFSFWIFISNICAQLFSATDTVIIGMVPKLATVGAAVYSIGYTFPNILFSLSQVVPGLFMPRANKMVFSGCSDEELTDLVIKVGRVQSFVVGLVCSGFIAFGQPFLEFYVGPDYSEAYWVAIIVMIPNCITLVQSACNSIMQAKNMHSFKAKIYIFIAVGNAVSTYFLVWNFGIIGAAIPTGLCYIFGNGLIMNWFFWKKMHLDIPKFWKKILPTFIVSAVLVVLTKLSYFFINYYSITNFLIGVVVYTIVYVFLCWFVIFNDDEKAMILNPVKKIVKRIKK